MYRQAEYKLFEDRIDKIIYKTNLPFLKEKHIKSFYSSHISYIDHVIITKEYFIAVKSTQLFNQPSNIDINNFRLCVNDLSKILNKRIVGIFLSLKEPTLEAIESIKFEKDNFILIYNLDHKKLENEFIKCLHLNEIYIYDENNVYMLGNNIDLL